MFSSKFESVPLSNPNWCRELHQFEPLVTRFARDMRLKNDTLFTDTAPKAIKTLRDAWDSGFEEVILESAVGRIAGDFVNLYPPGIPIIVPGEEISQDIVSTIRDSLSKGLNVQGISETGKIRVIT